MGCALVDIPRQTNIGTANVDLGGTIRFDDIQISDGQGTPHYASIVPDTTWGQDFDVTIKDPGGATTTLVDTVSDFTIGGEMTFSGPVNLNGTTTVVDTATLNIEDQTITLGFGNTGAAVDTQVIFDQGTTRTDTELMVDATDGQLYYGVVGGAHDLILNDSDVNVSVQGYDDLLKDIADATPNTNDVMYVNGSGDITFATPENAGLQHHSTNFDTYDSYPLTQQDLEQLQLLPASGFTSNVWGWLSGTTAYIGGSILDIADNHALQQEVGTFANDVTVVNAGNSPYTLGTPQWGHVLVAETTANLEIDLPASPATDLTFTAVVNGANDLTIDGNGKNIAGAGSQTLVNDGDAMTLIYDGTEWHILNQINNGVMPTSLADQSDVNLTSPGGNATVGDMLIHDGTEWVNSTVRYPYANVTADGILIASSDNVFGFSTDLPATTTIGGTGIETTTHDHTGVYQPDSAVLDVYHGLGTPATFVQDFIQDTTTAQAVVTLGIDSGVQSVTSGDFTAITGMSTPVTNLLQDTTTAEMVGTLGIDTGVQSVTSGDFTAITGMSTPVTNLLQDTTTVEMVGTLGIDDGVQDVTAGQFTNITNMGANALDTGFWTAAAGSTAFVQGTWDAANAGAFRTDLGLGVADSPTFADITGDSLNVGSGTIDGGAITGTSLDAGTGTIDGGTCTFGDVTGETVIYDAIGSSGFVSKNVVAGVITVVGDTVINGEGSIADLITNISWSAATGGFRFVAKINQDITWDQTGNIHLAGVPEASITTYAADDPVLEFINDGTNWIMVNALQYAGGQTRTYVEEFNTGMAGRTVFNLANPVLDNNPDNCAFYCNGIRYTQNYGEWGLGTNVVAGDRVVFTPENAPAMVATDVVEIVYQYRA